MSPAVVRTIDQRPAPGSMIKPGELIDVLDMALTLNDRRIYNLLIANAWDKISENGFLATLDDQAASRNLRLSRSRLARPYIWRLSVFSRFTCPSVWPLLQASATAACTAA